MDEISKLTSSESLKTVSTLEDCFHSDCFEQMLIRVSSDKRVFGGWAKKVWVKIEFRRGKTSGEQEIDANSMLEAFEKIAAFEKELKERESVKKASESTNINTENEKNV